METPVQISRSLLDQLVGEARGSFDLEVCGLLFGSAAQIDAAKRCDNVAMRPADHFEIDPSALIAAHRNARLGGPSIVGCYHSHPAGTVFPSLTDAHSAAPDGSLWLILGDGEVGLWRAVRAGALHNRFQSVPLRVA